MDAMISSSSDQPRETLADRRAFLRLGGITVVSLAAAACTSDSSSTESSAASPASTAVPAPTVTPDTTATAETAATAAADTTVATSAQSAQSAQSALTAAAFEGLGTCSLMPEKTAGPFPLDEQFDRRDVTEGYPGQPMRLGLRVLDESCAPVPGVTVEIWHTDASGDYSAFSDNGGGKDESGGTTFMRGTQTADADGIVEFLTIYPGWYSGRAVHIHLRVHIEDRTVLTSQMFFDDDYTASIYASEPYAEFGLPDTSNQSDGIAGDPEGEGTLLHTSVAETSKGPGTLALLNLGIDFSALA
jgi:protocatechuate 3,4-dioxygenase beta subunit